MQEISDASREAIFKAAKALGIDPETLALGAPPVVAQDIAAADVMEPPCLSDVEWDCLGPIIPRKARYLSKIEPRVFLDACLCLAFYDFKFRLVPTPAFNTEAFRAKFYRSCLAGVFADLAAAALTTDVVCPEHKVLLTGLRAVEERYVYRHRKIVEEGRDQLARGRTNPHEPR